MRYIGNTSMQQLIIHTFIIIIIKTFIIIIKTFIIMIKTFYNNNKDFL